MQAQSMQEQLKQVRVALFGEAPKVKKIRISRAVKAMVKVNVMHNGNSALRVNSVSVHLA